MQGVDRKVELSVPVLAVGNGRRRLILEGFVDGSGVVLAVGRAGEAHRCAECGSRMSLGILRVGPSQAEVPGLEEVGAAPFSGLVVGHVEREVSVGLVVHLVPGIHVHRP